MSNCSWPEQDAVDEWLEKNQINVTHHQAMELKSAVSKYRINIQQTSNSLIAEAAKQFRTYEMYHREKGTEDSLQKAEVNREIAEKLETSLTSGFTPMITKHAHDREVARLGAIIENHMDDSTWLLRQLGVCRESKEDNHYSLRLPGCRIDKLKVLARLASKQSTDDSHGVNRGSTRPPMLAITPPDKFIDFQLPNREVPAPELDNVHDENKIGRGLKTPVVWFADSSEPPYIVWKHIDGPLLVCKDGTPHWLTLRERFLLFIGKTTIEELNEKHRQSGMV